MYIQVFQEYLVQLGVNVPVHGVQQWDKANIVLNIKSNKDILKNKALRVVNWCVGSRQLCFKNDLIKVGIKLYGQNTFFNLHPYSFTLDTEHPVAEPSDFEDYDKETEQVPNANDLWIVKPAYGNNGKHIKIMTRAVLKQCNVENLSSGCVPNNRNLPHWLHNKPKFVVQKYIDKPCLLEKRKFDLRVLIIFVAPKSVFSYKTWWVRRCPLSYDNTDLTNTGKHLTNISLHKTESKQTTPQLNDFPILEESLRGTIVEFLHKLSPIFESVCRPSRENNIRHFQLFGVDLLIDEQHKPWLLEINASPQPCDALAQIKCYAKGALGILPDKEDDDFVRLDTHKRSRT
jgi:hypothetical protein